MGKAKVRTMSPSELGIRKIIIVIIAMMTFALAAGPERPRNSYVYDEDRLMTAQQVQFFNLLAEELYRKTGVGLAAALLDDVGQEDPRAFATNLAHRWGIGGKSDEGILIFVALKQRRRSVEVGYGAEGYLPDVLVERIQQKTLIPAFRQNKYGEGVVALAYYLAQTVAKEKGVVLEIEGNIEPEQQPMTLGGWIFILFVAMLLMMAYRRGHSYSMFGLFGYLMGMSQASKHNRRGPGGFGGGFGGGGFGGFGGGFGGGHFGGGGSGGSW